MAMANVDGEMGGNAQFPNDEGDAQHAENGDVEDAEITPEEYDKLDSKLDDLNIALDLIEQKNDKIRSEFLKLLHSNQQIREEFQQEMKNQSNSSSKNEPSNI